MKAETRQNFFAIPAIILIALSMRAPVGGVGPLVGQIQTDLGLNAFVAGFLTTIPLVAFSLTAPFAGKLAVRLDTRVLLVGCLLVSIAGLLLRSYAGVVGLFVGTGLLGVSLGTMNVLLPALLRSHYTRRLGTVMGIYSTAMTAASAIVSGISIALAASIGWEGSLASCAVFAVLAIVLFLLTGRTFAGKLTLRGALPEGRCFRRGHIAVAVFMGLQSFLFFSILAWFPSIIEPRTTVANASGTLLLLLQLCCLGPTFLIPILFQHCRRIDLLAFGCTLGFVLGFVLVLFANSFFLLVIGSIILGLAVGSTLSLAISLVAAQGRNPAETAKISGYCQCISYALAAFGPTGLGYVYDACGTWDPVLWCMIALSVLMALVGLRAGRMRDSMQ